MISIYLLNVIVKQESLILRTTLTMRIITLCQQTRAAVCSLVSTFRRRCDQVRSAIRRCSAVSELRGSDYMFTTRFNSIQLVKNKDIDSVHRWLSCQRRVGRRVNNDNAIVCLYDRQYPLTRRASVITTARRRDRYNNNNYEFV